jgi:hypothetical protein
LLVVEEVVQELVVEEVLEDIEKVKIQQLIHHIRLLL